MGYFCSPRRILLWRISIPMYDFNKGYFLPTIWDFLWGIFVPRVGIPNGMR